MTSKLQLPPPDFARLVTKNTIIHARKLDGFLQIHSQRRYECCGVGEKNKVFYNTSSPSNVTICTFSPEALKQQSPDK